MEPPSSTGDTTSPSTAAPSTHAALAPLVPAFVIAWSKREPHRAGEVALLDDDEPGATWILGRDATDDSGARRLRFIRQRPDITTDGGPLVGHALSRRQLHVERRPDGIHVENRGSAKLFVNGEVRFSPSLIASLLRRSYPANVRELDKILWQCMATSFEGTLRLPEHLRVSAPPQPSSPASDGEVEDLLAGLTRETLSADVVRESLRQHGSVRKASKALGVSRWALDRLVKKYGIRER